MVFVWSQLYYREVRPELAVSPLGWGQPVGYQVTLLFPANSFSLSCHTHCVGIRINLCELWAAREELSMERGQIHSKRLLLTEDKDKGHLAKSIYHMKTWEILMTWQTWSTGLEMAKERWMIQDWKQTNKQKCPYGSYTEMTREGRRTVHTWTSRWTRTD